MTWFHGVLVCLFDCYLFTTEFSFVSAQLVIKLVEHWLSLCFGIQLRSITSFFSLFFPLFAVFYLVYPHKMSG